MTTLTPQTGMVAFFDVLGYQQILLNNEIHATAELISDILINMPDEHMGPKVAVVTTSTWLAISSGDWVRPMADTSSAVSTTASPFLIRSLISWKVLRTGIGVAIKVCEDKAF